MSRSGAIAQHILALAPLIDTMLWQAAQREAGDAAPGEDNEQADAVARGWQAWRERWTGLRRWFVSTGFEPPQAELLRSKARSAIPQLLAAVAALNERRSGCSDRSADFRLLAGWFAGCDDDAQTHRLARAAFALNPVLRSALNREAPPGLVDASFEEASAREVWASAGVLVNELARPALVLNLPGVGTPGEPGYLSLRKLLRSPPEWRVQGRAVFVCENPNLIAIAADHLGPSCAPMVCTDGMPAAAQRTVLAQLAQAGAALRYHGDFDWPGLRMGNHMMREHGAQPWRFSTADYLAACAIAPQPGRLLQGAEAEASCGMQRLPWPCARRNRPLMKRWWPNR